MVSILLWVSLTVSRKRGREALEFGPVWLGISHTLVWALFLALLCALNGPTTLRQPVLTSATVFDPDIPNFRVVIGKADNPLK